MATLSKNEILTLLETNDRAIGRALLVLKDRQTADEQASDTTRHLNGRGFRPCHARMGTSMANFYGKYGRLSEKQVAYWRKRDRTGAMRIGIYWRQLLEAAEEKAAKKNSEMVTRTNLMTGKEYQEPKNTPVYLSPASETYWSM